MASRYLRHTVAVWAICISGTWAVAQGPETPEPALSAPRLPAPGESAPGQPVLGQPDLAAIEADVKFADKLNEFIRQYLSDAPGRAREMQGALKLLISDRAKDLLKFANLPKTPGLLTTEQIEILNLVTASYPDTEGARIAKNALDEHKLLSEEPEAQERLKGAKLETPNDELTGDQVQMLDQLRTDFPDSAAAKTANFYLARQRKREADKVLAELVDDFLKTPGAREVLDRLAFKRLDFAMSLVEAQRVIALEELIENFPNSSAAKVANERLENARRQINRRRQMLVQEAESSRHLREYWDERYPQRTWKYPVEQPGPNSAEYRPDGLPQKAPPRDGLPPVPEEMRKE